MRTAQTTSCCLVLNPSFLRIPDMALRTVRALMLRISPILLVAQPPGEQLQSLPLKVGFRKGDHSVLSASTLERFGGVGPSVSSIRSKIR